MRLFVTIASGATTSATVFLPRSDLDLAIHVSSAAASGVLILFSPGSGGPYTPLCCPDGSGAQFIVVSGSEGWGVLQPPTSRLRIMQSAATTDARTFTLLGVL